MKIISAGFPKTGTKSASEALRILGYNVCDVLDSAHSGIVKNWLDFMNGECTIEDVVEAYHQHGYDATQDLPGNLYWESLLKICPDAKIILTIRDTEENWFKSINST